MKKDEHLLKALWRSISEFVWAVLEFLQHDFREMAVSLIAGVFGTWYDRESMKDKDEKQN